jgi:hypothetical protein
LRKTPHYEVFRDPSGNYKVIVWEDATKAEIIASNSYGSYKAAATYGRAYKTGKYRKGQQV